MQLILKWCLVLLPDWDTDQNLLTKIKIPNVFLKMTRAS